MKLNLTFLIILLLTVGAIACTGSPTALKESENSVNGSSTLSRVALEVPTIF